MQTAGPGGISFDTSHPVQPTAMAAATAEQDAEPPPSVCCRFFELRRGIFAIGIATLILHAAVFVAETAVIFTVRSKADENSTATVVAIGGDDIEITVHHDDYVLTDVNSNQLVTRVMCFIIALLVLKVHMVFGALLLAAVHRRSARLLLVWLVYHGLACGLQTLGLLGLLAVAATEPDSVPLPVPPLLLLLAVPLWYWLTVVVRYRRQLLRQASFMYQQQQDEH